MLILSAGAGCCRIMKAYHMRTALGKFLTCFVLVLVLVLVTAVVIFPMSVSAMDEKAAGLSLSQRIRCFLDPIYLFSRTPDACKGGDADAAAVSSQKPASRSAAVALAPAPSAAPAKPASATAQKPKPAASASPSRTAANPGITRSELDAALRGIRAEILRAIPAATASYAAPAPASYYGGGYSVPAPNTASTDYVGQQASSVPWPWGLNGSANKGA